MLRQARASQLTEGAARLIARLADGAMRDALSMLDRAAAAGAVDEETVTAALGVMGQDDGVRLAEHLKTGDLGGGGRRCWRNTTARAATWRRCSTRCSA